MPIIPSRRKIRPIRSKISVRTYSVPAGEYGYNVALNASQDTVGTIQQSQKTRWTESVALTRALYRDVVLSPEHQIAMALELSGKRPITDARGTTKRRGLSGAALYKWVALQMRNQGYDATAQSVRTLLDECDAILALMA